MLPRQIKAKGRADSFVDELGLMVVKITVSPRERGVFRLGTSRGFAIRGTGIQLHHLDRFDDEARRWLSESRSRRFTGKTTDMLAPDPSVDRGPNLRSLLGAITIGGMFVFVATALVLWWTRTGASPTVVKTADLSVGYVGARACMNCHAGEHLEYRSSGHSQTLQSAASADVSRLIAGWLADDPEKPGVTWTYSLREGRFSVARDGDGDHSALAIDYALGSGRHATTFVTLAQGEPGQRAGLEHRLTYYAATKSLGLTPGQHEFSKVGQSDLGYVLPPGQLHDCFNCHATLTSARDPNLLDTATMIPNVSCERCHGPGRAHVERARGGAAASELAMPLGPGRASAEEEVRACGGCHRLPGKLRPAEIRPDNPVLARFPSVGLLQSKCYTASRGGLRCSTCHDPHARVSEEASGYDKTCLSCHQTPSGRTCSAATSPQSDCAACHMPRRDIGHGMRLTDHWIRPNAGESR